MIVMEKYDMRILIGYFVVRKYLRGPIGRVT